MNPNDIYLKTPTGFEEVKSRSRQLLPRLRAVLIMVDGVLTVSRLQQAAATLGAPEGALEQLEQQGLIVRRADDPSGAYLPPPQPFAPPPPEAPDGSTQKLDADAAKFRAALKFMNDNAVNVLKLRAYFFTLKLEKCYTIEDLRTLLPAFKNSIARAAGPDVAKLLEARARQLLGD